MGRVRTLTRATLAVVTVGVPAIGCATVDKAAVTVQETVGVVAPPQPASQLVCLWQRRLAPLPDPVRDGSQRFGLPGQVFMLTSDGSAADVSGALTIVVYDETQRPAGQEPRKPEVWHFTADTLKRMKTSDERFGPSLAMFLPWMDGWQDVTAVRLMARYDVKDQPTLYAGETKLTIDRSNSGGPVWNDTGTGHLAAGSSDALDTRSVPDPAKLMQAAQQAGWSHPVAAIATAKPPAPHQWPGNVPAAATTETGPLHPIIIPRR